MTRSASLAPWAGDLRNAGGRDAAGGRQGRAEVRYGVHARRPKVAVRGGRAGFSFTASILPDPATGRWRRPHGTDLQLAAPYLPALFLILGTAIALGIIVGMGTDRDWFYRHRARRRGPRTPPD